MYAIYTQHKSTVCDGVQHTPMDEFRMPISRRPVESKRRATRVYEKSWTTSKAATAVIRAALVSEETGSAFHPRGVLPRGDIPGGCYPRGMLYKSQGGVIHCHIR